LAGYFADVCLFEYNSLRFRPSLIASACVFLAYTMLEIIPNVSSNYTREKNRLNV
jgi:hypothetical protein